MTTTLSNRTLNRTLLARQLLLERTTMPIVEAVEHLGGLQAQAPVPPYLALWTRLDPFEFDKMRYRFRRFRGTFAISCRTSGCLRYNRRLREVPPAITMQASTAASMQYKKHK